MLIDALFIVNPLTKIMEQAAELWSRHLSAQIWATKARKPCAKGNCKSQAGENRRSYLIADCKLCASLSRCSLCDRLLFLGSSIWSSSVHTCYLSATITKREVLLVKAGLPLTLCG